MHTHIYMYTYTYIQINANVAYRENKFINTEEIQSRSVIRKKKYIYIEVLSE